MLAPAVHLGRTGLSPAPLLDIQRMHTQLLTHPPGAPGPVFRSETAWHSSSNERWPIMSTPLHCNASLPQHHPVC